MPKGEFVNFPWYQKDGSDLISIINPKNYLEDVILSEENEDGELKRSVNTFLQMLDNFKINTLLITATNHQHLLDKAIWRRFDEIMIIKVGYYL